MWMAYSEACDTEKPVDLKSAVEKYQRHLERLEFDASHEAVYGMGKFCSEDRCLQLAEEYSEASRACECFLEGGLSVERMLLKLEELKMVGVAMSYIEDFLPEELRRKFSDPDISDVEICVVDDDEEDSDADVVIECEEDDEAAHVTDEGYDEVDMQPHPHPLVDEDGDPITDAQGYVAEFYENPDAWTRREVPVNAMRPRITLEDDDRLYSLLDDVFANDNAISNTF